MVRSIIAVVVGFFLLVATLVIAGPVIDPLTEFVTSQPAVDGAAADRAENIQQSVVQWSIYVAIFGVGAYAVALIVRRERFVGGGRR
jgi:hypothetical protein